ncbi:hypothetical protein Tco_0973723 [Tanacetum coccineum]
MAIEESRDLTSLSLDELIRNLKVHELIIKKDSKIVKGKGERKSLALKAKKESSDEECSTFKSEEEEYPMVVRDFKKFFKRRGRCEDPNHLIGECLKPLRDKNQRAFVGGSWSDSGEEDDEKAKDEKCLWLKHLVSISNELVRNLPKLKFDQHFCDACKTGKQAHASHKDKNMVSTTRCLELLNMDLFGSSDVRSYGGNLYTLVIVDDYSSKAYIILNKHTMKIEESLNVTFDETPLPFKTSPLVDDDLDEEEAIKEEVVPKVDDVFLVDEVFDGVFGGDGKKDFVMGEGVRGRGLCGCYGREMKEMIVKMMNMAKVMTIYFRVSGLKK